MGIGYLANRMVNASVKCHKGIIDRMALEHREGL